MPKRKDLSRHQIEVALSKTKSIKAASRYLNCSYQHLKMWMKRYTDEETGKTLFEVSKNIGGKGIPKFTSPTPFGRKDPDILDVVEGRIDAANFNPQKIKYRMIEAGLMKEECHQCGFKERRVMDDKMPLLLHFKDGNKNHWNHGNPQLLCYNCYFLFYGQVFTEKQIDQMESTNTTQKTDSEAMQVDDYHIRQLKKLGLWDGKDEDDDPYSLVSRK